MPTVFLDACQRKITSFTPVWFMRQAGRSLPEYRKIKEKYDLLTICQTPELAAEVTLLPLKKLGVVAAVLFSDFMLPLLPLGFNIKLVDGIGPVISNNIESVKDINNLKTVDSQKDFSSVLKTIELLKKDLKVPLIGLAGAPFTLASYLIEGRPTRDFIKTKILMYSQPKAWHTLMDKLTNLTTVYLKKQIKAGVDAVQLFDSWVGYLNGYDYKKYVLPYSKKIFKSLSRFKIPLIHFGVNTGAFLKLFSSLDCNVVAVDWRVSLDWAWKIIGYNKAIQGNLDPVIVLADFSVIKKQVDRIFREVGERPGYIFNLGHGVLPATPVKNLAKLVEYVHSK